MSEFLLQEVGTLRKGRPAQYFKQMPPGNPMMTPNADEAHVFASEAEARQHPAFFFPWLVFEPVPALAREEPS